ncbi:HAD family hydrolase [Cumulibacter manganitolerans]|uniref:HAD family hydrolase n=1 Tax=Cumulibacter manganitolerans TaxID=1884992 RepID=UPI0012966A57|nr:HAD-IB family hydrolase [Cumulibacter manganitolerans]
MRLPWSRAALPGEARARAREAGRASAAVAAKATKQLPIPLDPNAAAFFDVDNTMMMGASIFHFAKGLAARKFFTSRDIARMVYQQAKFRVIGAENTDDIHSSRDRALEFVKGADVEEIRRLGEEIYDEEMAQKIYSGTRSLAQMHLDAGQRVWLVTATPVELASVIADRLDLTGALATVAEQADGKYTGQLVGEMMHGSAKAEAISALAAREGLDLARCTAYSDSINDLPMLSLVGKAVAVNPDPDLRREAIERGWEIRDYRTGRKAVKVGALTTLAGAAAAGSVVGSLALWRAVQRYRSRGGRR